MSTHTVKKYTLKTLAVLLWIIGGVLVLVALLLIALQIPKVQDFAASKAENYLQNKLGTEVQIGKFRSDFRKDILLENVYLEDQKGDTLWYSQRLAVNLDIFGLLKSKVGLRSLELENATAHMYRTLPDSVSNFDFILEAFATPADTTVAADTTSAGFTYDIGTIALKNIYLTYRDEVNGQNVRTRVGNLLVDMDELDLEKEIYRIGDIALRDTWVDMVQTKVPPEGEQEPMTMQFGLKTVALDRVKLKYRNGVAKQYIDVNLGQARMASDKIDLINSRIDLSNLELHNSTLAYSQNAEMPAEYRVVNPAEAVEAIEEAVSKATGEPVNWVFTLDKLNVTEVDAAFDNYDAPKQARGMDYNHLQARNLTLQLNDLYYSTNRTTAQLEQLSFQEKSGFEVKQFTAGILFDSVQTELTDLVLETGNSRIAQRIRVGYPSLETAAEDLSQLTLSADFRDTHIGFGDIALLQPALVNQPPLAGNLNQTVHLSGVVNGRMDNLLLSNVRVSGWRNTALALNGRIRGLPNPDNLAANLQINRFHTTAADVKSLLPAGILPANITLPPSMDLEGSFNGTMTAFDVDATLRTTFGNAVARIDMTPGRAPGQERIEGNVRLLRFDLGRLMQNPALGRATLGANINGTGLTPENMVANIDGTVQSFEYGGYNYHNLVFDVDANRNRYAIKAHSTQDPNLDFALNGTVDLRGAQPAIAMNANLRAVDFQALKLYAEDLRLRGDIVADLRGADANSLNGSIIARNTALTSNNRPLRFDSLAVYLVQQPNQTQVRVLSDVLTANLNGNLGLGEIGPELMNHISRYYDLGNGPYKPSRTPQQFTFGLALHKPRVFSAFVPGLTRLRLDTLYGGYNSQTANLQVVANVPRLRYTNIRLDSLLLEVNSNPEQLNYTINAERARQDTLQIENIVLAGNVQDNVVATRAAIQNEAGQDQTALGVRLSQLRNAFEIRLDPDLLINRDQWTVAPNNYVRYYTSSGAVVADALRLSNGPMSLALQSQNPQNPTSPLNVNVTDLDIGYLARAFLDQDSLVGGILNGQATVNDITGNMSFTADMALSGLEYQTFPVGDLTLQANNPSANRYNMTARLTGYGNNVTLAGYYLTTEGQPMSFDLDLGQLNLASLQPFTAGMVKNMGGNLTGDVAIRGTLEAPSVVGDLQFREATFNVAMLNSTFRIPDERLTINNQGIQFNEFVLLDSLNNRATINGAILTSNFLDYQFDLRAVTDDFMAMNSTAQDNSLYYGRVLLDSDTRITGDLNVPVINTSVTVVPESNFTYVVPPEEVGVNREGIVVFVDVDSTRNRRINRPKDLDTVETAVQGIEMAMTLNLTDETPITVIVDPETGDNLTIRGDANLNVGYDVTENITLTGRFDVTEGRYAMNLYELVKREFEIDPASYVAWTGDPFEADANITAIYNVDAAPLELIQSQTAGVDAGTAGQYRNKLPFDVRLNLSGELMKPAISFNIELDEKAKGAFGGEIDARLEQLSQPTQESERTKQVFSLLVLGRFMAQDPLASSGGGGINSALRGSASKVLSDQLNALTGQYLGGLGLELGLNSYDDYSSGEAQSRTDLNVAMQRQLLNERLTIRFGTDIPLGGSDQGGTNPNTGTTSGFAGDVSVEYSVTKDGRLRLRAFRNNSYEGFLDGQLQRTGISLLFVREYDSLADLFKNTGKAK
ncbi:translocation/assembly module TamB domain-containing protein [Rufibacter psychrotolerans]|uniref:translocation/assembly module TamB domain-containing protein n=1 Tax=Rufibacter psychrotolerans TaxID=2812556 RepID=UPI0019687E20|nr:translocation/assembly module TamB [Rufibacter sp. SYSU D00308]